MINLTEKNVLCNSIDEFRAILKEAVNQEALWVDGNMINIYQEPYNLPIVLCFDSSMKLSWCNAEDEIITDLAKDLLNPDREMTALEFLNKFLDMAYNCSDCQKCKNININEFNYKWCESNFWTKENIEQVYEIVKTGNKLKDFPEQKAIDNLKNHWNSNEEITAETLQLAIKALEEKLNEK